MLSSLCSNLTTEREHCSAYLNLHDMVLFSGCANRHQAIRSYAKTNKESYSPCSTKSNGKSDASANSSYQQDATNDNSQDIIGFVMFFTKDGVSSVVVLSAINYGGDISIDFFHTMCFHIVPA
ncbi:hypothetical protein M513_12623 [Trichuris suis]|uniref:Uncharacterized protein n=1 Tax=Trichuris suis TaxID=68888 RepID=A0A085LNG3_9BILA|nr:hypothetical protein M513_12623 [Trichuris suis]